MLLSLGFLYLITNHEDVTANHYQNLKHAVTHETVMMIMITNLYFLKNKF